MKSLLILSLLALSLCSNASKIKQYLKNQGFTSAGAAGLMGTLDAKSELRPDVYELAKQKIIGLTQAEYVRKTNEQWFKEKLSGSNSQNNDYLNEKRDYLTRKEKEEKIEMEASMKIDKMLDEIRREKRVKQMIKERQEQLQKKLKEKDVLKAKPKKKKMEKKKKTSNFFLEAMGVTEEEMNKKMEEEILNEKENERLLMERQREL